MLTTRSRNPTSARRLRRHFGISARQWRKRTHAARMAWPPQEVPRIIYHRLFTQ